MSAPRIIFSGDSRIELEVGGVNIRAPFGNSIHYCRPSAPTTVKTTKVREEDQQVHKNSWWIICDLGLDTVSELRCSWEGVERGFRVAYHNGWGSASIKITEAETKDLLYSIERMLLVALGEGDGAIMKDTVKILKPTGTLLEYRVIPIVYEREHVIRLESGRPMLSEPSKKKTTARPFH